VDSTPQDTTVDNLRSLTKPATLPADNRIPPTEETTFRLTAQVQKMKLEDDHDIHLVIADLSNAADTMIVEFPDVACEGAAESNHKAEMAQARQEFTDIFGQPSASHFTDISGVVVLTGVGFFDFLHGQTGVAPNGIELHPVLSIHMALVPGPGDADCDGQRGLLDVRVLLGDLGGVGPSPSANPCNDGNAVIDGHPARDDSNCDGFVDVFDVLAILKSIVGLESLPASC
jgi:hypothetical protein